MAQLREISLDEAKRIATAKGLKPGRVKGTDGVQFTKGSNNRLEVIDWDTFKSTLETRNLRVYESSGWMKIRKAS
jgi:hypothetical protein